MYFITYGFAVRGWVFGMGTLVSKLLQRHFCLSKSFAKVVPIPKNIPFEIICVYFNRFGFITFCQESAVTSVLQVQEGMKFQLDGCKLDVKHAFKRSDEEGGVPPVQKTKKPFVPRNVFENFKSSVGLGDAKVFVGGLGKVCT